MGFYFVQLQKCAGRGSLKINLSRKKIAWHNTKRFLLFQAAFDDLRQPENEMRNGVATARRQ
ncbi:hypothetical protein, partial [Kingella oralis]